MVASFNSCSPNFDPIDHDGIAPDTNVPCSPSACYGSAADPKASSHKESRRSVPKRVVTVPVAADGLRPKGDGAPPSDSWAWRKYGQKPIKGSPYPRGYYKCSSSKGCPARKQVERSRVDPTVLVVTYACEHNHPWNLPKNLHHQVHHHSSSPSTTNSSPSPSPSPSLEPLARNHFSPPDLADPEDKFSGLAVEAGPVLMMGEDYYWFSDVGSPCSTTTPPGATDDLLLGDIVGSANVDMTFLVECDEVGGGGEEDSLFAGLGELPECSMVFQRGLFDRQRLVKAEESRRCNLDGSQ